MNYNDIAEEYAPSNDIFDETSQFDRVLKHIIFNELSEIERRILLLYAEIGNQRGVGKALNVSAATVNIKIREIRKRILESLNSKSI